jgi:small-conductance mechanosensitive channel
MNIQKSTAHIKENKKRIVFFLKLFLFLLMVLSFEYYPSFKNTLLENSSLLNAYKAATFLLGGNILVSLGRMITARIYLRKSRDEKIHGNFLLGITWISNILNVVIFLIALMLAFNIRPLEFLTSLTIVAAAIAILSKDYVTNMINGLIIMFTDQISLGDTIQLGDQKGIIEDITLLNLILKNENGDKVIIPNTLILTSQVINHHKDPIHRLTFEFELPNLNKIGLREMEEYIFRDLMTLDLNLQMGDFNLDIVAIEKDSLKLKAEISVPKPAIQKVEKALKNAVVNYTSEKTERKSF